jgi:hypothetical protein
MLVPRVRFTVRRMLVAVAIVAVVMGALRQRHLRFKSIADHHFPSSGFYVANGVVIGMDDGPLHGSWMTDADREMFWHRDMYLKYNDASRYPWLPVGWSSPESRGLLLVSGLPFVTMLLIVSSPFLIDRSGGGQTRLGPHTTRTRPLHRLFRLFTRPDPPHKNGTPRL